MTLLNKFKELGFSAIEFYELDPEEESEEDEEVWADTDLFVELVLFVVSLGVDNFQYKIVERDSNNEWNIGGYGLFNC